MTQDSAELLLERLRSAIASIGSKAEISKLEPVLEELAAHLGAETMVISDRVNEALVQRTHLDRDRLTGFKDDWDALVEHSFYEWSPGSRAGQAAAFPEATYGRVVPLQDKRQQEAGKMSGTLTLIMGDRPFDERQVQYLSWLNVILAGLFMRLDRDLDQEQAAAMNSLREATSARLLPFNDADTGSVQAVTDVLAAIAESFDADEVIWGNRQEPNEQHSSQRYVRSDGRTHALPNTRLEVVGGIDSAPDNGITISSFADRALRHLGHDPAEMSSSVVWVTPLLMGQEAIGGLALFFYANRAPATTVETRCLGDITSFLAQYEVRMTTQRALDKRHTYDEFSVKSAHELLEAAHHATSTQEIVELTLSRLCETFGADMGTLVVDGEQETRLDYGTPLGHERNQTLLDQTSQRFIRDKAEERLGTNGSAIVSYEDFSEDEQALLDRAQLSGVTAMATRLAYDDHQLTCGVLSWQRRKWADAEISALQTVSSLLHQTLNAIEMRQTASTIDDMDQLATRTAAKLIEHPDMVSALNEILADIAQSVGGLGAVWVEFNPSTQTYDLLGGRRLDGTPYPIQSKEIGEEAWRKIYDFDWVPGFYTHLDPPMDTVASISPEFTWLDRILIPVKRNDQVVSILDIQVDDGPRSDSVITVLSTIAGVIHEAIERDRMERLYSTTFDSAPTGQLVLDGRGVVKALNGAATALGIIDVGQHWTDVDTTFSPNRGDYEFPVEAESHTRWLRVRSSSVELDATRPVTIVHVEDISAQRAAQASLEHDATHDQLTGLANRRRFNDELTTAVRSRGASVIMVDIDRFKSINDSLGHQAGDAVLIALADRLRSGVRDSDLACRFGGDEFAVLAPGEHERHELAGLASRLVDKFRQRFDFDGHTVIPTCSIGIASIRQGEDPETVLRYADAALVTAKRAGRNGYAFFDHSDADLLRNRLDLEMGIRNGLERNEFAAWFQPEYDLRDGSVLGLEALMRWRRPGFGTVPAAGFIDIAEEIGAATNLSQIALEQSFELASELGAKAKLPKIRVNIAPSQLHGDGLETQVLAAAARHGLPPEVLCLEVTERSVMVDVNQATEVLSRIRTHGIEVALDDFGTGFSSLALIKRLPIDTLKIDRSFVEGLVVDSADREIARTIVNLADALDLDVVAEGVEEAEQVAILRDIGCSSAQGWLWSPAVEANAVGPLLDQSVTV